VVGAKLRGTSSCPRGLRRSQQASSFGQSLAGVTCPRSRISTGSAPPGPTAGLTLQRLGEALASGIRADGVLALTDRATGNESISDIP
jgi:hypothetical protein